MDASIRVSLCSTRATALGFALALLAAGSAAAAGWPSFAGNAQHTGLSPTPAQPLATIRWSTPVDLAVPPSGSILIHYGSPVITPANTVIVPVKTGAANGYRVDARSGATGALLWTAATDYLLPPLQPFDWTPAYQPVLAPGGRVYYAGAGGTLLYRDNLDAASPLASGRLAFYGLANYQSATVSFTGTVFVNTPITADSQGNIWFGFRTTGTAPLGLVSGIARIDAAGNGSWVSAATAAGDASVTRVPHQAAPTLSNDEATLYVVVAGPTAATPGYLVGLDPATLGTHTIAPGVPMRVALKDPRNGGTANADLPDQSSASPTVGPDGDVYYGVMGTPFNDSRGWLLHYSGDLAQTKVPGAFGWDNTSAVVPAAAVPSYAGTSAYLVFAKYNDYAGLDGGNGVNRLAVLDPNVAVPDTHPSSGGTPVMKAVLAIAGPTPDEEYFPQYPDAVREWCLNAAAVDPATKSIMANSEDGKLYRWDLATNTLTQAVTLSPGIGEAYTSTLIGPDGTVYATNWAILNAVGADDTAPALTGVVSRKTHGSPGVIHDLTLAATPRAPTVEPRIAGAGGSHALVFAFNKPVTAAVAEVTEGTAGAGTLMFAGNEVTVPLTGTDDVQYVTIALHDVVAQDGGTGGTGSVRIGFLMGDVNGNRVVTLADRLRLNAQLTQDVTPENFRLDVNGSNSLTLADILVQNANLTQVLPPP